MKTKRRAGAGKRCRGCKVAFVVDEPTGILWSGKYAGSDRCQDCGRTKTAKPAETMKSRAATFSQAMDTTGCHTVGQERPFIAGQLVAFAEAEVARVRREQAPHLKAADKAVTLIGWDDGSATGKARTALKAIDRATKPTAARRKSR